MTNHITPSVVKRFWSKIDKRSPDECWKWTAGTFSTGYGALRIGSKKEGTAETALAHRLSYELHYGPIPDDMHILHSCDCRPCVNPQHLFLGTQAENVADMIDKGRQARGKNLPQTKLTKDEVRQIRRLYNKGFRLCELVRKFSIARGTIADIIHYRTWKHVT